MLARLPLKTAEPRGTLWPVDRNRSDRRSETVAQHQQPAGEPAYRSVEFDRPCLVVASTRFWAPGTFECRLGLVSAGGSRGPWCNRTRHPAWPGRARPRSSSPHRWSAARQSRPVLPPRPTTGPGAHGRPRRADGRWTTSGPATTTPPSRVPVCRRTSTRPPPCRRCCHRWRASHRSPSALSRRCSPHGGPGEAAGRRSHQGPPSAPAPTPAAGRVRHQIPLVEGRRNPGQIVVGSHSALIHRRGTK